MSYKKHFAGTKHFNGSIDVTDPCYSKDTWCRINDINITAGQYDCVAWLSDNGEFGIRCMRAGIYLKGTNKQPLGNRRHIGTIGVDAGLAGFFENKPDYSDEEWSDFCNKTFEKDPITGETPDAWIFTEGFFTSSGYGDGLYDVYAYYKDDNIIALEIDF